MASPSLSEPHAVSTRLTLASSARERMVVVLRFISVSYVGTWDRRPLARVPASGMRANLRTRYVRVVSCC
ncbi:hypothetical protein GCM10011331_15700 [Flavimobilis marinus]|nr:hypothetical protein GCM10011331_15700 [Flavimobilis marinus]